MKNVVLNPKRLILILAVVLLTYGAHGISYGQVCAVGDILSPGESCTDPGTGNTFSVLADGRGGFTAGFVFIISGNRVNIQGNVNGKNHNFIATNRGDGSWEIESVTPGGTTPPPVEDDEQPPETDTAEVVSIPDPNLRAKVEAVLRVTPGSTLTASDMARLTSLSAQNANISNLTGLEGATKLTHLTLGFNSVSDISPLSGLTNLIDLDFQDNSISDISSLAGLTNLTHLDLYSNSISDISSLSGLINLTHLRLDVNNITDISSLAGLTNLTHLDLNYNNISDISSLSGLTNLTYLTLYNNDNISDISSLSGLTNLTKLLLGYHISDISPLADLTNLEWLWLGGSNISDISSLSGLTNLTWLWLNYHNISDSDLSLLSELTNLEWLYLGYNNISDISSLSGLTNLEWLSLYGNNISDISSLSGLTNLTWLVLENNAISDVSPLLNLNLTGKSWDSTGLYLGGNPLSYASINAHIPAIQAKGIEVKFDNRTPTTLLNISGDNQSGAIGEVLSSPFVVEVRDQDGTPFEGVPVMFAVTAGGGKLSATTATTDANGLTETTLTLGSTAGANTVLATVDGITQPVTFNVMVGIEFDLTVSAGTNLIHVPLKVTAVDGAAKRIDSIADLYDALGGANTVNFLITYDTSSQAWLSYFSPADRGTAADRGLTDEMGILAGMKTAATVRLRGNPLGTNGTSTIGLNQGLNLVGLPLRDSRITRASDLLALDGIRGNVPVIILSDAGDFKSVGRAGDPGDVPIIGGQGFMLTVQQAATVAISGEGWSNASATAAAPQMLTGIGVTDTTPVLALRGEIVDEGTGLKVPNFRVTVKNLSTGREIAVVTEPDDAGYRSTIIDIETGRAATIGDTLEISARSPNPFIGVEPLRYTVTAEDVKRSLIQLPELIAYEIPKETELLANYPNPFNPETWMPYRLAEDGFVTLTIYDGVGHAVRTIDVGHRIAAVYESRSKAIYWNGRNEFGEGVASGVYFYHLSAGDFSATRKMLILK